MKREREARGIPLKEISEHTKIGVRLLQAIEREEFHKLPGGIFNKSFVRHYARYLGLDEEKTAAAYLQAAEENPEAKPSPGSALPEGETQPPAAGYLRLILTALFLGIAAAGILFAIYRVATQQVSDSPGPAVVSAESKGLADKADAPSRQLPPGEYPAARSSAEADSASFLGAPSGQQPHASLEKAPALAAAIEEKLQGEVRGGGSVAEKFLLQIDALNTVWLSITADGEQQWEGILAPQQTRRIRAGEIVQLTVGDASGVALTLNGEALPPLGGPGEVKRLAISANGLREPPH